MITSLKVRESLKIEKYLTNQVMFASDRGKQSALDAFARSLEAFKDFVETSLRKQDEKHELERKIWERDHSELRRAESCEIALMQMFESQCEKLEKQRDLANEKTNEMSRQIELLKKDLETARHEKNVAESEVLHILNGQTSNAYVFPSIGDEDDDSDEDTTSTHMYSFPQNTPGQRRGRVDSGGECDSSSVDSEQIYIRRRRDTHFSTDSEIDLGETGRNLISSQGTSHILSHEQEEEEENDEEKIFPQQPKVRGLSVFSMATATTPAKRRR